MEAIGLCIIGACALTPLVVASYFFGKSVEREVWFKIKIAEKESEKMSTIYKAEIISEWVSYSKKDLEKKLNEVINKEEKENTIRVKIIG